jgi:6-phosphofructokinase 1
MRIGVLTSGGDAPGMNAVLSGALDRATNLGIDLVGIEAGFAGLCAGRTRALARAEVDAAASRAGTILGTSRFPELKTPSGVPRCLDVIGRLELDGLIVVGGEGSIAGAAALAAAGATVVAVPATIDNDVPGTGMTIGHDSAVNYGVRAIDDLRMTATAMPGRSFVVQTLGGSSGNLARAVAAATGVVDVIVPETRPDLDAVAARIRELTPEGYVIVVMGEGAGNAVAMADDLSNRSGMRVHYTILGHSQRGAAPTTLDLALGRAAGSAAVDALATGRSGLVTLSASTPPGLTAFAPHLDSAPGVQKIERTGPSATQ